MLLYDGECALCHRSVRWLLAHERGGELRFAPLQGETATGLRRQHASIPSGLETVVLVDAGRVHVRSAAFLHVARYLRRPWRWAYHLRLVPAWLLDPPYRLIARLRYRLFGRLERCEIPRTDRASRLLP